jgi:hypothetical protein
VYRYFLKVSQEPSFAFSLPEATAAAKAWAASMTSLREP